MPCYDSQAAAENRENAVTAANTNKVQAEYKARIAWLEAALCGTRAALVSANYKLGNVDTLTGLDFEKMGITRNDYLREHIQHTLKDALRDSISNHE